MTPRPSLSRARSHVAAQTEATMMATYTMDGGFSAWRKRADTATAATATMVWKNMPGLYGGQYAGCKFKLRGAPPLARDSFARGPSVAEQPRKERASIYSGRPRPLRDGHSLAAAFNHSILPAIIRLLYAICPTTIGGRVRPIVVNSIQGSAARTRSQIRVKRSEAIIPSIANYDSTPPVVGETLILGVLAAATHRGPYSVLKCVAKTVRSARTTRFDFFTIATAGDLPTHREISCTNDLLNAAITATQPMGAPRSRGRIGDHNQAAKRTAQQIDFFHRSILAEHAEVCNG